MIFLIFILLTGLPAFKSQLIDLGGNSTSLPVIQLSNGNVIGKVINVELYNGSLIKVQSYLGIPYAEPPIGENRFKPPIYKSNWTGILNASTLPPMCPQDIVLFTKPYADILSEDCLYLNVWTPNNSVIGNQSRPVLFYIHGGSYQYGYSGMWPPYMIVQRDIIYVAANYRLGILGAFTTGDEECVSNLGMRDQVMALEWIQTNIRAFGGDPTRVTIMGQSSGAGSVGLHLLSPLSGSRNLFHSIVSMSGTAVTPWAYQTNPLRAISVSRYLARRLGCLPPKDIAPSYPSYKLPSCVRKVLNTSGSAVDYNLYNEVAYEDLALTDNTYRRDLQMGKRKTFRSRRRTENAKMMKCLRQKTYKELLGAGGVQTDGKPLLNSYVSIAPPWAPVVDGSFFFPSDSEGNDLKPFVPLDPVDILTLTPDSYPKLPFLMGMNRNEDSTIIEPFYAMLVQWADNLTANGTAGMSMSTSLENAFASAISDFLNAQNVSRPQDAIIESIAHSFWSGGPRINSLPFRSLLRKARTRAADKKILIQLLSQLYRPWNNPGDALLYKMAYVQLLTDVHFVAPLDKFSKIYVPQGGKIFQYLFEYRPELTQLEEWQGVGHSTDLPYMFGTPFLSFNAWPYNNLNSLVTNFTNTDRAVANVMLNALENFIKFSHPTLAENTGLAADSSNASLQNPSTTAQPFATNGSGASVDWPYYQSVGDIYYMHIDARNSTPEYGYSVRLEKNFRETFRALWNGFIPSLIRPKMLHCCNSTKNLGFVKA